MARPEPGPAPVRRTAAKPAVLPDGDALPSGGLKALRAAAENCRRCDLWKPATQVVFGEGPARARVMLIGEQPGDREDLSGHPFVGPAGGVLERALDELGIDRRTLYLTNAVKHFKFVLRGKRRIHQQPNPTEQRACHVWLEAERARIRPRYIGCLGAIAAKAVFGSKFGLMRERGQWRELPDGALAFATVHPSFVLRQRSDEERELAYRGLVKDLRLLLALPER